MWILNSFSLNMLACLNAVIKIEEVSLAQAQGLLDEHGMKSGVGHQSTAALFAQQLGRDVPCAGRVTVTLVKGDAVLVGQYSGPRLEEGTTTLPPGATIKWCRVTILS